MPVKQKSRFPASIIVDEKLPFEGLATSEISYSSRLQNPALLREMGVVSCVAIWVGRTTPFP